ncbi:hypothetical protein FAM09_01530 [Niastella caeni]|uniref:Uncharacterized protein n=1 Tax=Niastella caeni TaxID=2569763 RepID=A0A4S8HZK4_9BACT|nr:hypothetical protein [Niastella caeni]THU40821.1 hypothetical protein FAM09_01530 [Niastella caeni]
MAGSSKRKGKTPKENPLEFAILEMYFVSEGAFTAPPDALFDNILKYEGILRKKVFYKKDIIYLLGIKPVEASWLVTAIRQKEGKAPGRGLLITEFIKYTGVSEKRVEQYVLGLLAMHEIYYN